VAGSYGVWVVSGYYNCSGASEDRRISWYRKGRHTLWDRHLCKRILAAVQSKSGEPTGGCRTFSYLCCIKSWQFQSTSGAKVVRYIFRQFLEPVTFWQMCWWFLTFSWSRRCQTLSSCSWACISKRSLTRLRSSIRTKECASQEFVTSLSPGRPSNSCCNLATLYSE